MTKPAAASRGADRYDGSGFVVGSGALEAIE
jgi:hypothetical protein